MSLGTAGNTGNQVRAFRGATQLSQDSVSEMSSAVAELLQEMLLRNKISQEDLVSIFFTATPDLISDFPATGARSIGFTDIPLICAVEIAVPGSLPRCVRVMMHATSARKRSEVEHVYLRGAITLRKDLQK
jgi:chorismate mutase